MQCKHHTDVQCAAENISAAVDRVSRRQRGDSADCAQVDDVITFAVSTDVDHVTKQRDVICISAVSSADYFIQDASVQYCYQFHARSRDCAETSDAAATADNSTDGRYHLTTNFDVTGGIRSQPYIKCYHRHAAGFDHYTEFDADDNAVSSTNVNLFDHCAETRDVIGFTYDAASMADGHYDHNTNDDVTVGNI